MIFGVVCLLIAGYYGSRVWEAWQSSPVEQSKPAAAAPGDASRPAPKTEDGQEQQVDREQREALGLDDKIVISGCATMDKDGKPNPVDTCLRLTPEAVRSLMGRPAGEIVAVMGASGAVAGNRLHFITRATDAAKSQTGFVVVRFERGKSVLVTAQMVDLGPGRKSYAWLHDAAEGEYFCSDFPSSTTPCWPPIPPEARRDNDEGGATAPDRKVTANGASGGGTAAVMAGKSPEIEAMEPGRRRIVTSPCTSMDADMRPDPSGTCQPITLAFVHALRRATLERIIASMGASGYVDYKGTISFHSAYKSDDEHIRYEGDTGAISLTLQDGLVTKIKADVWGPGNIGGIYEWSESDGDKYSCANFQWQKIPCPPGRVTMLN